MNTFNRVSIIIIAFLAIASAVCLLLVVGRVAPGSWSDNLLAVAWQSDPAVRAWTIIVCSVIVALALLLLFMEFWPASRRKRLLIKRDGLGEVTVSVSGVEDLVSREAIRVPGVVDVTSHVSEAQDGLHILGRVAVTPDASIPDLSSALQQRIKGVVEHHLGRFVTEVHVDAQLAHIHRKTRRVF